MSCVTEASGYVHKPPMIDQPVEPSVFRALLLSSRQLRRSDDPDGTVLGLFEPTTSTRFVVEAERLFHIPSGPLIRSAMRVLR